LVRTCHITSRSTNQQPPVFSVKCITLSIACIVFWCLLRQLTIHCETANSSYYLSVNMNCLKSRILTGAFVMTCDLFSLSLFRHYLYYGACNLNLQCFLCTFAVHINKIIIIVSLLCCQSTTTCTISLQKPRSLPRCAVVVGLVVQQQTEVSGIWASAKLPKKLKFKL